MPRVYRMSWEGHPAYRWTIMVNGVRHRVNCSKLGLPRDQWTKEASGPAANKWCERLLAELQAATLALNPYVAGTLEKLQPRLDYAKRHGLEDEAKIIEAEVVRVKRLPEGVKPHEDELPDEMTGDQMERIYHDELVWEDRLKREKLTPADKTIGALVQRWCARQRDKAFDGKVTLLTASQVEYRIRPFLELVGESSGADAITADLWERFRDRLEGRVRKNEGKGREWAKNQWHAAKDFVNWLWANRLLDELPRNFLSLKLKVGRAGGVIETFHREELKALWTAARGQQRLHLLLGLNCGFYPWDVAVLSRANVNLRSGTLRHRRTKTRHKTDNAPTVTYKLWPETVTLLSQFMASEGDVALLNQDGKPWIRYTPKPGGGVSEADGIRQWWDRVVEKSGIPHRPFKTLRKTAATALEGKSEFSGIVNHFLANTGRELKHRHYAKPSDTVLGEALDWLRLELGVTEIATA